MKRWLVLFVLVLLSVSGAQQVQLEQEVFNIAGELRCPVCRSESAADSNSESSIEFRTIIREGLEAGESREQIIASFQRRYGDWILLDPPRRGLYLWVWGLPLAAGLAGLTFLGVLFLRWRKNAAAPAEISLEERERVQRELGHL